MRTIVAICCAMLGAMAVEARAGTPTSLNRVVLMLPEKALGPRVHDDADALSSYMTALQKETSRFWANLEQPEAKGVLLVIGLKPEKRVRVWCEPAEGSIDPGLLERLARQLELVPALPVYDGPIAFGLEIVLGDQKLVKFPNGPKAWTDAARAAGHALMIPDAMFEYVWPDEKFAERLAYGDRIELQSDVKSYFSDVVYPGLRPGMAKIYSDCALPTDAEKMTITIAADVSATGTFENLEFQPKTRVGSCCADGLAKLHTSPPPAGLPDPLTVVIEMNIQPRPKAGGA